MPTVNKLYEAHPTIPAGTFIRQSPAVGTPVARDAVVTIWISLGPATTAVPNIVGLDIVAAQAAILQATLVRGAVTYTITPLNTYKVTAQSPAAASQVATGSTVGLTVNVLGEVTAVTVRGHGSRR
jgi:serine/threonine-protein kinase